MKRCMGAAMLWVAACGATASASSSVFTFEEEFTSVIDPDVPGIVMWDTSLAFSSDGDPRVAYMSPVDKALVYAWSGDGGKTWERATVDDSTYYTLGISLRLDAEGNPFILYGEYEWPTALHPGVRLARSFDGGLTWEISTVSTTSHYTVSLALDADGNPHALYDTAMYGGSVVYARSADGGETWTKKTIASAASTALIGSPVSLALDGAGNPHAAYAYCTADESVNELRYACSTDKGETWKKPVVQPTAGWVESVALAAAVGGGMHLGYAVNTTPPTGGVVSHEVRYARLKGGALETPAAVENVIGYPEVKILAPHGVPVLLYHNNGLGGHGWVKAAHPWAGGWSTQEIVGGDVRPINFSAASVAGDSGLGLVFKDSGNTASAPLIFTRLSVEYDPPAFTDFSVGRAWDIEAAPGPGAIAGLYQTGPAASALKPVAGCVEIPYYWPLRKPIPEPDPNPMR